MPSKDELKLQKERINLAKIGQKVFQIQKDLEDLEHRRLKKLNDLDKAKKDAEEIKIKIENLEVKIKAQGTFDFNDRKKLPS